MLAVDPSGIHIFVVSYQFLVVWRVLIRVYLYQID
jgi:hypothetical protein